MNSTTFTQPVLLIEVITLINQESVPKEFACSMREKPECFFKQNHLNPNNSCELTCQ